MTLLLIYLELRYIANKPMHAEKRIKLDQLQKEQKRELSLQELIDQGYTSNFRVHWHFLHFQLLTIVSKIWEEAKWLVIIIGLILLFFLGLYIGNKL